MFRLAPVGALALAGCSLIVPLDEFGTGGVASGAGGTAGASNTGASDVGAGNVGAGGAGGAEGGGGGGPVLCPDGELLGSDSNCGECGHDCLETTCEQGECQPLPFLVAGGLGVLDIAFEPGGATPRLYVSAVNAEFTYFVVARLDTADPNPTQWTLDPTWILGPSSTVHRLLIANDHLMFSDALGLVRANTSLPAPADLATVRLPGPGGVNGYSNLAANITQVVRTRPEGDLLEAFALNGAAMGTIASGGAWDLAVTSNQLFWTARESPGGVYRSDAGVPFALQTGGTPADMVLAGSYLYWTRCAAGEIWRLDVAQSGAVPERIYQGQSFPFYITAVAGDVYWVNLNQDVCDEPNYLLLLAETLNGSADIVRGSADGSEPTLRLKSGLVGPTTIAIDGNYLYAAHNPATGAELLRVAR